MRKQNKQLTRRQLPRIDVAHINVCVDALLNFVCTSSWFTRTVYYYYGNCPAHVVLTQNGALFISIWTYIRRHVMCCSIVCSSSCFRSGATNFSIVVHFCQQDARIHPTILRFFSFHSRAELSNYATINVVTHNSPHSYYYYPSDDKDDDDHECSIQNYFILIRFSRFDLVCSVFMGRNEFACSVARARSDAGSYICWLWKKERYDCTSMKSIWSVSHILRNRISDNSALEHSCTQI